MSPSALRDTRSVQVFNIRETPLFSSVSVCSVVQMGEIPPRWRTRSLRDDGTVRRVRSSFPTLRTEAGPPERCWGGLQPNTFSLIPLDLHSCPPKSRREATEFTTWLRKGRWLIQSQIKLCCAFPTTNFFFIFFFYNLIIRWKKEALGALWQNKWGFSCVNERHVRRKRDDDTESINFQIWRQIHFSEQTNKHLSNATNEQ